MQPAARQPVFGYQGHARYAEKRRLWENDQDSRAHRVVGRNSPAQDRHGVGRILALAAHALYGGVTVYLLDEFERQRTTQPKTWQGVQHARVG
jgi:hypothetical protein